MPFCTIYDEKGALSISNNNVQQNTKYKFVCLEILLRLKY